MSESNRKPTRAEYADRVSLCRKLIISGLLKCDVKRLLKEKYGTSYRTAERYLARARSQLVEETGLTLEENRAESKSRYLKLLQSKSEYIQLKAQERIDRLLGLEAPAKHAATDTEGHDLRPAMGKLTDAQVDALAAVDAILRNGENRD